LSITFEPGYAQGSRHQTDAAKGQPLALLKTVTVQAVRVVGLSDEARADLLSRLPVHEGDSLDSARLGQVTRIVKEFDSHLMVLSGPTPTGEAVLTIGTEDAIPNARIRVGGNAQSAKLIYRPVPHYPVEPKQAHIQGVVKLYALIGRDGAVKELNVISGHPLLTPAAVEAVKQWVYQPTLLNGNPIEVETEIDVNFTLAP
jgi:TonB family protein